jgi:hypothetical protein
VQTTNEALHECGQRGPVRSGVMQSVESVLNDGQPSRDHRVEEPLVVPRCRDGQTVELNDTRGADSARGATVATTREEAPGVLGHAKAVGPHVVHGRRVDVRSSRLQQCILGTGLTDHRGDRDAHSLRQRPKRQRRHPCSRTYCRAIASSSGRRPAHRAVLWGSTVVQPTNDVSPHVDCQTP